MYFFFFFNDTATTEIYTLSLHDALPISRYAPGAVLRPGLCLRCDPALPPAAGPLEHQRRFGDAVPVTGGVVGVDRKSTRLNSSHANISYAVFCLKKKKKNHNNIYSSTSV